MIAANAKSGQQAGSFEPRVRRSTGSGPDTTRRTRTPPWGFKEDPQGQPAPP